MKKVLAVTALLGAVLCIGMSVHISARRVGFLLGGIQVNEPDHGLWFDALEREGFNTVSVTVYARQGDWDSDNLWWSEEEPGVMRELTGARRRGLHTVLIPRVALDHAFERNEFLWHGLIHPSTDERLASWFDRYREFVLEWARVAREQDVEVFALGSELNTLASTVPVEQIPPLAAYYLDEEKQLARRELLLRNAAALEPRHLRPRGGEAYTDLAAYLRAESDALAAWAAALVGTTSPEAALERINARRARLDGLWRGLIAEVRSVYDGRITFAANFDQYREVGFWDALDLIGINAYFPLRRLDDPPGELSGRLAAGWRRVFDEIEGIQVERGLGRKPVLFTEIGYTSRAGATLAPWAGSGFALLGEGTDGARLLVWDRQPDDPSERALALRALHAVHLERGGDLLQGLLYWKLSTRRGHREIEPFVHVLGATDDPLAAELRRFRGWVPLQRLRHALTDGTAPGPAGR